jgi:hypothetical protein
MITSGFTNAPVSQFLVFSAVIGALFATITDTRYYLPISVVPHIWTYGQFWRFLTWQVGLPFVFPTMKGATVSGPDCSKGRIKANLRHRHASPIPLKSSLVS